MQKWIQPVEKQIGHLDYTELITQIYRSNNFLPNFRQMSQKKQKRKTISLQLYYTNWFVWNLVPPCHSFKHHEEELKVETIFENIKLSHG